MQLTPPSNHHVSNHDQRSRDKVEDLSNRAAQKPSVAATIVRPRTIYIEGEGVNQL